MGGANRVGLLAAHPGIMHPFAGIIAIPEPGFVAAMLAFCGAKDFDIIRHALISF
jgi:hypothetical protein